MESDGGPPPRRMKRTAASNDIESHGDELPLPLHSGKKPKRLEAAKSGSSAQGTLARVSGRAGTDGVARPTNKMQLLQAEGEKLFQQGQFESSFAKLKTALVFCPCNKEVRHRLKAAGATAADFNPIGDCSCKDFVQAAQTRRRPNGAAPGTTASPAGIFPMHQLDLSTVYDLATRKECCCGSGRRRCSEMDHISVVNSLAITSAKLRSNNSLALDMAQWLIDLAPHRPEGYLHLGKAVSAAKGESPVPARFVARCIYHHGLHNISKHGDPEAPLAKVLAQCCKQYSREDYIQDLPTELVEQIFQHLSLRDIVVCTRVSKSWASVLQRAKVHLPKIVFGGAQSPGTKRLARLLKRIPLLKTDHLVVNCDIGGKNGQSFLSALLRHFDDVNRFELKSGATFPEDIEAVLPGLVKRPFLYKCRHLVLRGPLTTGRYGLEMPAGLLKLVRNASQTLESLDINRLFGSLIDFPLQRLKCLRVSDPEPTRRDPLLSFIASICKMAPGLEQLYLDSMTIHISGEVLDAQLQFYEPSALLKNLHTLIIGSGVIVVRRNRDGVERTWVPRLPPTMRCIDIQCIDTYLAEQILFPRDSGAANEDEQAPSAANGIITFPYLEAFRCRAPIPRPERLFDLLRPSMDAAIGRLMSLELNGEGLEHSFLHDPRFRIHSPQRLRTFGLHGLDWDSNAGGVPGLLACRRYLDWVVREFPNLEMLSVQPLPGAGNTSLTLIGFLEGLLQSRKSKSGDKTQQEDKKPVLPKLHTIFHSSLSGHEWTRAMQLGAEMGIRIIVTIARPVIFPWPERSVIEADSHVD